MPSQLLPHLRTDTAQLRAIDAERAISITTMNDFQFVSKIGTGSFATVFKAIRISTRETVAIKQIHQAHSRIIKREIEVMQSLDHPNILRLLDYFEQDEFVYLVLEHCDMDIYQALNTLALSQPDIHGIFSQVLDGLEHCHQRGVSHRDIKPENILLCQSGNQTVRLADFGLATKDAVSYNLGCGSLRYMSPECINIDQNSSYESTKCDVWSAAILLLNLLTARNPWHIALESDFHYSRFLDNPTFLQDTFHLSNDLFRLMLGVFVPARHRIDISEFKRSFEGIHCLTRYESSGEVQLESTLAKSQSSGLMFDLSCDVENDTQMLPLTPTIEVFQVEEVDGIKNGIALFDEIELIC